jgi:hypothetical protein
MHSGVTTVVFYAERDKGCVITLSPSHTFPHMMKLYVPMIDSVDPAANHAA